MAGFDCGGTAREIRLRLVDLDLDACPQANPRRRIKPDTLPGVSRRGTVNVSHSGTATREETVVADNEDSKKAFEAARARSSVAQSIEAKTLHTAIFDARERGLSIREAAAELRVSKSTVARHWREGHRCLDVIPTWGNTEEYLRAARAVWAHVPAELDDWVPYEWDHTPEGIVVRACSRGTAVLGADDLQP